MNFTWGSLHAKGTPMGTVKGLETRPGNDFVIDDYDTTEIGDIKPDQTRGGFALS